MLAISRLGNLLVMLGVILPIHSSIAGTLTAQVASLTNELAVVKQQLAALNEGRRKVAFSARFSRDDVNNGIHLGHRSTLKFDSVLLNLGNGYNPLTGVFTAPVAGLYVFTTSSMTTNGREQAALALVAQGVTKAMVWGDGRHDLADQDTKTVPVQLDEGDKVWVEQRRGDAVRGDWWTTFSGFLVQAD